ncbi:MAG TPA: M56 family metallopeptidase, partial [Tahibacter sp.]|uniref:M56 family metallopeptidase n=1 Tax=Tahibacter sp. TaxID=2056211 RepID=UPI002B8FF696
MTEYAAIVGLTLLTHAGAFLALAWIAERFRVRSVTAREYLWRSAVLGSLASAALQLSLVPASLPLYRVTLVQPTAIDPATTARDVPPARVDAVRAEARATSGPTVSSVSVAPDAPTEMAAAAPVRSLPPIGETGSSSSMPVDLTTAVRAALPVLLALWVLAALFAWLRVARGAVSLARWLRGTALVDAQDWRDDCSGLAAYFGLVRVPTVRCCAALASPLATPQGVVVVPEWALRLPRTQRRALLAHEFAHIARRDPQWRVVLALWRGLLFPLPLASLALARLDALAEWQCDAAAARATGDARALAACLAHCLERRLDTSFPALAVAMAAPRSPLLQRAERLLEGVSMSVVPLSWRVRLAPLAAVVVAVLAVPAFVAPVSFAAERDRPA